MLLTIHSVTTHSQRMSLQTTSYELRNEGRATLAASTCRARVLVLAVEACVARRPAHPFICAQAPRRIPTLTNRPAVMLLRVLNNTIQPRPPARCSGACASRELLLRTPWCCGEPSRRRWYRCETRAHCTACTAHAAHDVARARSIMLGWRLHERGYFQRPRSRSGGTLDV